jgi:hypothetical protein
MVSDGGHTRPGAKRRRDPRQRRSNHRRGRATRAGRLEFKTDDAGTLYLEWDKLSSLVAKRLVEVLTTDGRRFLGSLGPAADRSIAVVTSDREVSLQMAEVTLVTPIGTGFWQQLDGSIDAGFSYTRSSGVAQLNLNSDTVYRRLASRARLTASLTQTKKDDESERDDRAFVELSYLRIPGSAGSSWPPADSRPMRALA